MKHTKIPVQLGTPSSVLLRDRRLAGNSPTPEGERGRDRLLKGVSVRDALEAYRAPMTGHFLLTCENWLSASVSGPRNSSLHGQDVCNTEAVVEGPITISEKLKPFRSPSVAASTARDTAVITKVVTSQRLRGVFLHGRSVSRNTQMGIPVCVCKHLHFRELCPFSRPLTAVSHSRFPASCRSAGGTV